jgi:hypothetical protein
MEQGHRLAQRLVAAHPLFLDLGQPFLIAFERRLDRLQQGLQLLLRLLARLVEAGVGALEEMLLGLAEKLAADLAELGGEGLPRIPELGQPVLEIALLRLVGGG